MKKSIFFFSALLLGTTLLVESQDSYQVMYTKIQRELAKSQPDYNTIEQHINSLPSGSLNRHFFVRKAVDKELQEVNPDLNRLERLTKGLPESRNKQQLLKNITAKKRMARPLPQHPRKRLPLPPKQATRQQKIDGIKRDFAFTPDGVKDALTQSNNKTFISIDRSAADSIALHKAAITSYTIAQTISNLTANMQWDTASSNLTDTSKFTNIQDELALLQSVIPQGNYNKYIDSLLTLVGVRTYKKNSKTEVAVLDTIYEAFEAGGTVFFEEFKQLFSVPMGKMTMLEYGPFLAAGARPTQADYGNNEKKRHQNAAHIIAQQLADLKKLYDAEEYVSKGTTRLSKSVHDDHAPGNATITSFDKITADANIVAKTAKALFEMAAERMGVSTYTIHQMNSSTNPSANPWQDYIEGPSGTPEWKTELTTRCYGSNLKEATAPSFYLDQAIMNTTYDKAYTENQWFIQKTQKSAFHDTYLWQGNTRKADSLEMVLRNHMENRYKYKFLKPAVWISQPNN